LKAVDVKAIKALIDEQCSEAVPVNDSKPVIMYLASKMAEIDSNTCVEISSYAVGAIKSR
jgi:hypothetical protein